MTYPPLSIALSRKLRRVPASHNGVMDYHPCAVVLRTGERLPCVYIVKESAYRQRWGPLPGESSGRREVCIDAVESVSESPYRLPAGLADELYRAGESGMGYYVFQVLFRNGVRQSYLTGSAVDFVDPPPGCLAADAVAVFPHAGRQDAHGRAMDYHWCLYGGIDKGRE